MIQCYCGAILREGKHAWNLEGMKDTPPDERLGVQMK